MPDHRKRGWRILLTLTTRPALVAIALGLLALPLAADGAQPANRWRVGLLHVGSDHMPPPLGRLREGLRALGYEEGKNFHLDFRNLADEEGARTAVQEFVRERVNLIVAFGNPSVRVAKAATTEIPVVFYYVGDPVADGLVKSFNHPGQNLTGVVALLDLHAKQMELFKELVPRLRRLLVLIDPADPATGRVVSEVRKAGAALKVQPVEREAAGWADIERIVRGVKRREVDGVLVASPNLLKFQFRLARLVAEKRLPLAGDRKELAQEGALFSYAPDLAPMGRAIATYVDKILKGAKPADLPVEQPMRFELVINMKTAKALGVKIPHTIHIRGPELIE